MNGQTDFKDYGEAWTRKMTEIWRDRLDLLGVYDTGALRRSVVDGRFTLQGNASAQAAFQFLEYGIYVDAGTGNGYTRGNPGDLKILDKTYRHERGMGRQREKRPWFSPSWAISRRVLADGLARIMGDEFSRLFDDL